MNAFTFTGSGKEYFKIWIVNIVLIIITLGIYYPWAKVRNKRYFYANTNLENRNFEYHATGKQLLVGYLIAMGVLIAYIIFNTVAPIFGLIIIIVFALSLPWIIVRSMLFNMKMTSFSNVRFGFIGTTRESFRVYFSVPISIYVALIVLNGIILAIFKDSIISFFLAIVLFFAFLQALSHLKKIKTKFLVSNIKYGQSSFNADVNVKPFLLILLKTIGIAIITLIMTFIIVGTLGYTIFGVEYFLELFKATQDPTRTEEVGIVALPILTFIYIILIIASIFITAYKTTKDREYIFKNTTLGEKIKFSSTLEPLAFGWVVFSNLLLILISLGFATPWTKVRLARYVLSHTFVESEEGLDVFITEKTEEQSALGEQIGDAFDVDVSVGI